ncbi:hypothetical protein SpCBS45565_g02060 [Spizellomyces sp. 'palustris']|nr:hypothetical protein SpCBS45565_g02060 [Spizellomyces sp. 'palustris']
MPAARPLSPADSAQSALHLPQKSYPSTANAEKEIPLDTTLAVGGERSVAVGVIYITDHSDSLSTLRENDTSLATSTTPLRRRHTSTLTPLRLAHRPSECTTQQADTTVNGLGSPISPSLATRKRRKTGDSPLAPLHSAYEVSFLHEDEGDTNAHCPFGHRRSHSITDLRSESLDRRRLHHTLLDGSTCDSSLTSIESIIPEHMQSESFTLDNLNEHDIPSLDMAHINIPVNCTNRSSTTSEIINTSNERVLEPADVVTWNAVQHEDGQQLSSDFSSPSGSPQRSRTPTAVGNISSKLDAFNGKATGEPGSPSRLNPAVVSSSERLSNESDGIGNLWGYFKGELFGTDFDESPDVKKERIQDFLSVPFELEKLMFFGYLICFDSFLHIFTILPLRIVFALWTMFKALIFRSTYLKSAQKCDLMKGALIGICCYMLQHYDASQIYHSVRGQALIKLYVIFNVLEICDKLCSAFGHDILDSLFSKATVKYTLANPHGGQRQLGRVKHFLVALCYVFTHSIVLFYQVMTLNVSINSYNNALMTLLLSNQFVEIKGSVFKRFEKENLFQLSCADIVERFQLSVFLCIITLRNFIELTGGLSNLESAISYFYNLSTSMFAPSNVFQPVLSFPSASSLLSGVHYILSTSTYKLIETLATPVVVVFGTEILVDWLKHAFISKFNHIKPAVYGRFRDSLCRDLSGMRAAGSNVGKEGGKEDDHDTEHTRPMTFVDQSPAVARRIGFVSIPLSCLVIRVTLQTMQMLLYLRSTSDDADQHSHEKDLSSSISRLVKAFLDACNPSPLPSPAEWFTKDGVQGLGNALWRLVGVSMDRAVQEEFGRVIKMLGMWIGILGTIYLSLLCLKLVVGLTMQRAARRRAMQLHKAGEEPVSDGFESRRVSSFPPKRSNGQPDGPKGPPVNGKLEEKSATGDKLDRIERFTMVKSRIV